MKAVQCHLVRLLAILYLWTSGAVLWHTHDHAADDSCTIHVHDDQDSHHDEEHCSICFFLQNGTADIPFAQTHINVFEKPFFIPWNEKIDLQYDYLYIHFPSNKDPPHMV